MRRQRSYDSTSQKKKVIPEETIELPESTLFRQQSGIDTNIPNRNDYKMIRSILMDEYGKLQIKQYINELFSGILTNQFGTFEFYGHPSTLLIDNQSIVMASQIYDREFTEGKAEHYNNIITYNEYFKKRHRVGKPKITWLGAPSAVYTYRNRELLKPYLNNSNNLNLFFWLTSFNSSTCLKEFAIARTERAGAELPDIELMFCDKYTELKQFCKKWQIHNTYSNYYSKDLKHVAHEDQRLQGKFLTNFESCFEKIIKEDDNLNRYNHEHGTNFYQRYNEMFTYFYPWDLEGIEIGNIDETELLRLLREIHANRMRTIDELKIIRDRVDIIDIINYIINIITRNVNFIEIILQNIHNNTINYTLFLIAKILLLSECNLQTKIAMRNFNLQIRDRENVINLIEAIVFIMEQPLKLYEYELLDKRRFKMKEVGVYHIGLSSINRNSRFALFEQKLDMETQITNIYLSDKQLVTKEQLTHYEEQQAIEFNRNNFGGKKKSTKKSIKKYRKRTYRKRRYT